MIVRTEHSTESIVEVLERQVGPVRSWLHDKIIGDGWSVTPYVDYRKVWLAHDYHATILMLSL